MNPKLQTLLINWKVAGFVDCQKEWQAIEDYLWQREFNEDAKHGKELSPQECADQFRLYAIDNPKVNASFYLNLCADMVEENCVPLWNREKNKFNKLLEIIKIYLK